MRLSRELGRPGDGRPRDVHARQRRSATSATTGPPRADTRTRFSSSASWTTGSRSTFIIEDVAVLLAQVGEVERAFELLGGADAVRHQINSPRPPTIEAELASAFTTAARESLGDGVADAAIDARTAVVIRRGGRRGHKRGDRVRSAGRRGPGERRRVHAPLTVGETIRGLGGLAYRGGAIGPILIGPTRPTTASPVPIMDLGCPGGPVWRNHVPVVGRAPGSESPRRRRPARRRSSLTIRRAGSLFAAILLIAQATIVTTPVARGRAPGVRPRRWTATGPDDSLIEIPHDGTSGGLAQLVYTLDLGVSTGVSGTWRFETTATVLGRHPDSLRLERAPRMVPGDGQPAAIRHRRRHDHLRRVPVREGPDQLLRWRAVERILDQSGNYTFGVYAGDTFGFELTGSNADLNSFLKGSLNVGFNTVGNGGFEQPTVSDGSIDLYPSLGEIPSWSIPSGSVQIIGNSYWPAVEGAQSLDLDGEAPDLPGVISQTISTIPGQLYDVDFQYSANKQATVAPSMDVKAGDQVIGSFSHDVVGKDDPSLAEMQWLHPDGPATFTATGSTTVLSFVSTTDPPNPWGIALDDVTVFPDLTAPVETPATDFSFGAPTRAR